MVNWDVGQKKPELREALAFALQVPETRFPQLPDDMISRVEKILFEGEPDDLLEKGSVAIKRKLFNCLFAKELNFCLNDELLDQCYGLIRRHVAASPGVTKHTLLPNVYDLARLRSFDEHQTQSGVPKWSMTHLQGQTANLATHSDWSAVQSIFQKRHADPAKLGAFCPTVWEPGHCCFMELDVRAQPPTCTVYDSVAIREGSRHEDDKCHRQFATHLRFLTAYRASLTGVEGIEWEVPPIADWKFAVDASHPSQAFTSPPVLGKNNDCAVFTAQGSLLRCLEMKPSHATHFHQDNMLRLRLYMLLGLTTDFLDVAGIVHHPPLADEDDGVTALEDAIDRQHELTQLECVAQCCADSLADGNGDAASQPPTETNATPPAPSDADVRRHNRLTVKVPGHDYYVHISSLVALLNDDYKGYEVPYLVNVFSVALSTQVGMVHYRNISVTDSY